MIDVIYIVVSHRNMTINQRRYFTENKIYYIPAEEIKIFKTRNAMERYAKKESLLLGIVKIWGIDFVNNKCIPVKVHYRFEREAKND